MADDTATLVRVWLLKSTVEFRFAEGGDLGAVVALLKDDGLGILREGSGNEQAYVASFERLIAGGNHLIVGVQGEAVVACCELSWLESLTHRGTLRAQIEGVRVSSSLRGVGLGRLLIEHCVGLARAAGVGVVQLTTDKRRPEALRFYESLGFVASHEGLKLALDGPALSADFTSTFQVSVKGLAFKESCVLLLRGQRGNWELPGGRVGGSDESLEQALGGEFLEETRVAVGDPVSWEFPVRAHHSAKTHRVCF